MAQSNPVSGQKGHIHLDRGLDVSQHSFFCGFRGQHCRLKPDVPPLLEPLKSDKEGHGGVSVCVRVCMPVCVCVCVCVCVFSVYM